MVHLFELRWKIEDLRKWFEHKWNHSLGVAVALVLLGVALALFAALKPQTPGISIGILGLVAGIMSLRPEMRIFEKLAWIVILTTFAILEINAIGRADKENRDARTEQNNRFQTIVDDLKTASTNSHEQYEATIGRFGTVVKGLTDATEQSHKQYQETLNTVTGGKTFCYADLMIEKTTGILGLGVIVKGNYILRKLQMRVVDYQHYREYFKAHPPPSSFAPLLTQNSQTTELGDVPPPYTMFAIPVGIDLDPGTDKNYNIEFRALNGAWEEELRFQRAKSKKGWTEAVRVRGLANGKFSKPLFEYVDEDFPRVNGEVDWNK
jgi:hypothetical protein